MSAQRQSCFFAMPFGEELRYFYLFLKNHIEANYPLDVERGDTKRLTRPIMEKVRDQIEAARLVIADVSGGNPNVMYEVGLAHEKGKPVIFLTQDAPEVAPIDVRHFDLTQYALGDEVGLLDELDRALRQELADQFADYYERACTLLDDLNSSSGENITAVSKDVFHQRLSPKLGFLRLPDEDDVALAQVLLPLVVQDSTDMRVILALANWMNQRSA